jgi:branched-chain amino acid transport system ATP-binding protein
MATTTEAGAVKAGGRDVILACRDMRMEFHRFAAVDGVSLAIERGSIHALIGPNGAGKTTCFNLLTKFLTPTGGTIVFNGRDITGVKPAEVARLGLVRSFQISAVFDKHDGALTTSGSRCSARLGDSFAFWQSENRLRRFDDAATSCSQRRPREYGADQGGGTLLRPQARAGARHDPGARAGDDAARRADGRDGAARTSGASSDLIRTVGQPHGADGGAQPLRRRRGSPTRITVLARGKVLAEGDYAEVSADPRVIEAYIGGEE